jgi:hypothetical protein
MENVTQNMRLVAVLDANCSPVDNYRTIVAYINAMPLEDRVEMMLTLKAFIGYQLRG